MGDGDRNRMGKNSSRWLRHWLLQRKTKEVGIIRIIVNLFIGGDFCCTSRINLRAKLCQGAKQTLPS